MKERRWSRFIGSAKAMAEKNRERDRGLDRHVEKVSRFLWPFQELWLFTVVGSLFVLDFASTYAALDLSGNPQIHENGPISSWALRTGGFGLLFLTDVVIAALMALTAIAARYLYGRSGLKGYGRAAFVILLAPYIIATTIAVVNNIIMTFS